jgi:beta-glucanase (GH16 family)
MVKQFIFIFICTGLVFSCKKKSSDPPPVIPVVMIQDASITRTTNAGMMQFALSLNKTTSIPVSVDYVLEEGTATTPEDYTDASGTVTIPANEATAQISVLIKGDPNDTRENNLVFTVKLSNPKDCQLGSLSATGTILTENGNNISTSNEGYTTPLSYTGYNLVWNDEFEGNQLDLSVWNQEIGNGASGWGNNELEYYTNSKKNTLVSNGNLVIEARKESIGGYNYSSGRMTTQNKKSFQFGRIDIRAKLPEGKGIWPALWMLGSNITTVGWPASGEIDIMEMVAHAPSTVHGTMHWMAANGNNVNKGTSYNLPSGKFSDKFHVFSIIWTEDTIQWLVDDNIFLTNTKADVGSANYPFNAPQFFIFNVAVGGNWPGSPDATTVFPQRMFVDYVRVFQ